MEHIPCFSGVLVDMYKTFGGVVSYDKSMYVGMHVFPFPYSIREPNDQNVAQAYTDLAATYPHNGLFICGQSPPVLMSAVCRLSSSTAAGAPHPTHVQLLRALVVLGRLAWIGPVV